MEMIEKQSANDDESKCIQFIEWKNEDNYISIEAGQYCHSLVGKRKKKGSQRLFINTIKCMAKDNIAHLLMHALGFNHEEKRPDRDHWITMDESNIIQSILNNCF
jgi:hypothetical protein